MGESEDSGASTAAVNDSNQLPEQVGSILPSQPEEALLDSEPVEWVRTHLGAVREGMENWRQALAKNAPYLVSPTSVYSQATLLTDFSKLSEMPGLCLAWEDVESSAGGLPDGFSIVNGYVQTPELQKLGRPWDNHTFLQRIGPSGERIILDLTAAQFIPRKETSLGLDDYGRPTVVTLEARRGERMEVMMQRAQAAGRPDLYTQLDDEVAVVYGTAGDIKQYLGLDFLTEQPS